jgi:hypothetical protein
MGKKIIGILVIGLVISLMLPIGGATLQRTPKTAPEMNTEKPASQLEITLKGGLGIHVFIKNTGTTDVHVSKMQLNLDGARIKWNTDTENLTIKAGKTKQVIYVVTGLGVTNIELTIDAATQTASGKVLLWFVYGVN